MAWVLLYLAVGAGFLVVRTIGGAFSKLRPKMMQEEYIEEHGHEVPRSFRLQLYFGVVFGLLLCVVGWPVFTAYYFFMPSGEE